MEPVEINAGEVYLRALRDDDRVDDTTALVAAGIAPDRGSARAHVRRRAEQWLAGRCCSWAVCEVLTGDVLGEVALDDLNRDRASATYWTFPGLPDGDAVAVVALGAAVRFGFHGLGLQQVVLRHAEDDPSAAVVADKSGFTQRDRYTWVRYVTDSEPESLR
ncbi:GNAT family N-acetyltransferase [Umezawaea beigongshangensis]|uniref:GNAT family N-acetyltransferase n=1 Tax=Umezawaea beigongshangensis TaxID=2780383 RepID=UPI0018F1BB1A|nr:GNAT family N-acetyltransferase [Umezawaea beigongshangensis]